MRRKFIPNHVMSRYQLTLRPLLLHVDSDPIILSPIGASKHSRWAVDGRGHSMLSRQCGRVSRHRSMAGRLCVDTPYHILSHYKFTPSSLLIQVESDPRPNRRVNA
jgi:hypothetical protein